MNNPTSGQENPIKNFCFVNGLEVIDDDSIRVPMEEARHDGRFYMHGRYLGESFEFSHAGKQGATYRKKL